MTTHQITAHVVRSIAVEAMADPRTVRRVLRGERAKGMVHDRIVAVLRRRGIHVQRPSVAEKVEGATAG